MSSMMVLLIPVCMILEAMFSGLETGVISIHRMRLRHSLKQGSAAAAILTQFLENTDRLLGTTLVGTNICVVITSTVAASLAGHAFGEWGEPVSSVCVTVALLICCEYVPKAWFHSRPLERCSPFAGFLRTAETILHPISVAVLGLTRLFLPGPSTVLSKSDPFVTREELTVLAREGAQAGVLSHRESTMIRHVLELSGKHANQIMVPRDRITSVRTSTPIENFLSVARASGYTRFPVFDEKKQEFTGMLNVYHVLLNRTLSDRTTVGDLARPPLFIPSGMPSGEVLARMRRFRQPLGLVRDETGKVVGLLSIEDILQQIVGKL